MVLIYPNVSGTPAAGARPTRLMLSFLYRAALLLKHDPGAALTIMTQASDLIERDQRACLGLPKRRLTPCQARTVTEYIDNHLHRQLKVGELAALVGQSTGHFSRNFKESFGNPPYAIIQERRVERAKQMIEIGGTALCDIAMDCGLSDQARLSRVFRRHTGSPPGAWRRRHLARARAK